MLPMLLSAQECRLPAATAVNPGLALSLMARDRKVAICPRVGLVWGQYRSKRLGIHPAVTPEATKAVMSSA